MSGASTVAILLRTTARRDIREYVRSGRGDPGYRAGASPRRGAAMPRTALIWATLAMKTEVWERLCVFGATFGVTFDNDAPPGPRLLPRQIGCDAPP
jgi:hypothetical protein